MQIKNNKDLKNAIQIVWMLSALTFVIILTSILFLNENSILNQIPICVSKKAGGKCFLCGTTRAFIEIIKLNFTNAYFYNKLSILIFTIMALNSITYSFYNIFKKSKANL